MDDEGIKMKDDVYAGGIESVIYIRKPAPGVSEERKSEEESITHQHQTVNTKKIYFFLGG